MRSVIYEEGRTNNNEQSTYDAIYTTISLLHYILSLSSKIKHCLKEKKTRRDKMIKIGKLVRLNEYILIFSSNYVAKLHSFYSLAAAFVETFF